MRLPLVICFALLCKMQVADYLHWIGRDMSQRKNLPHRSLGLTYSAWSLEPHRIDYAQTYLSDWLLSSADYQLIEGQQKPVVPIFASKLTQDNLDEEQFLAFSHMITRWKLNQRENVKLTITKEERGEKITARIE